MTAFLRLIAASQLILAALTLFAPIPFATWMGLTPPPSDSAYLMAMLGARFAAMGLAMLRPERQTLQAMALIQAMDFAAGATLMALGTIGPATAAFPMVNAALFCGGLLWILRR